MPGPHLPGAGVCWSAPVTFSFLPLLEHPPATLTMVPPSLHTIAVTLCTDPTASTGDGQRALSRTASTTSWTLEAWMNTAGVLSCVKPQFATGLAMVGADYAVVTEAEQYPPSVSARPGFTTN